MGGSRTRRRRWTAVVGLVTVMGSISACGGDSGDAGVDTSTSPTSASTGDGSSTSVAGTSSASTTDDATTPSATNGPQAQTVTLADLPADWRYGERTTVQAIASSGLPLTITATGACRVVDGNLGILEASGVGDCSVTASQTGDERFAPASATRPTRIEQALTDIRVGVLEATWDARRPWTFPLGWTTSSGANLTYTASLVDSTDGTCTVADGRLVVDGMSVLPLKCRVTASAPATSTHEPATATHTFTLNKAILSLSIGEIDYVREDDTSETSAADGAAWHEATINVSVSPPWVVAVTGSNCEGFDWPELGTTATASWTVPVRTTSATCEVAVATQVRDGTTDEVTADVKLTFPDA